MKPLALLTAAAAAAATLAATTHATTRPAKHLDRSLVRQVTSLRRGIAWHRAKTWGYQDAVGLPRTPTRYAERRTRSVPFLRWIDHTWSKRRLAARHRMASVSSGSVPAIICRVFGAANCQEALYIARRESGFYAGATNGQYLGIFQMGSGERATYATIGYTTVYQQTVAAFNLFKARGWEPWTCCEG